MKLTALVATLFLGLSSAAVAAPASTTAPGAPTVRDHRGRAPAPAPIVRDHRVRAPRVAQASIAHSIMPAARPTVMAPVRPFAPRWTLLDTLSARPGRQVIQVQSPARFSRLKLEATRGPIRIDRVVITFANGRTQVVELDRRLDQRGPAVIDLNGGARQVTRIVITTKGNRRGAFTVLAG